MIKNPFNNNFHLDVRSPRGLSTFLFVSHTVQPKHQDKFFHSTNKEITGTGRLITSAIRVNPQGKKVSQSLAAKENLDILII